MRRRSLSDERFEVVAERLTDRDRWLCEMLLQHKVLTTNQICDLAFDDLTTTRHRMLQLHQLGLVDRFRPHRTAGSAPLHHVLDDMGAEVVAATRGIDRDQLGWRRDRSLAIATSQRLGHLVGLNGVFTSLVRSARSRREAELRDWWSEQRCAAEWGEVVRPDGFGRWAEGGVEVAFFVEYDCGTERLGRITAKLAGYDELADIVGNDVLLFVVPTQRRETEVRRAVAKSRMPLATAFLPPGEAADGRIWQPVGQSTRRRLIELRPARTGGRPSSGSRRP